MGNIVQKDKTPGQQDIKTRNKSLSEKRKKLERESCSMDLFSGKKS